jgi:hypothetical protein
MFVVSNIKVMLALQKHFQKIESSLGHQSHQVSLTAAGTSEDMQDQLAYMQRMLQDMEVLSC